MEGEPIEYVKRACEYVVDMLEPNDILSIVTFEEQVDVLMPARRVVNKALVKEHIRRIEVGNTTNLYDGLMAGCMQISAVQSHNGSAGPGAVLAEAQGDHAETGEIYCPRPNAKKFCKPEQSQDAEEWDFFV